MPRLVFGAFIISFSPIFVKLAHVPADSSAFYRMLFGGLGLWAVLLLRRAPLLPPPPVLPAVAACAVFFSLDLMCWHRSVLLIGPGLGTILGNFQAFLLAVHSVVVLRERPSVRFLVAVPLAMAGLLLMVGPQWMTATPGFRPGVLYGLATALFYTLFLLALKGTASRGLNPDPAAVMGAVSLGSALFLGGSMLLGGESFAIPDTVSWVALLAYALLIQVAGWVVITRAMEKAKAAMAGLVLLAQPTLAYVWDLIFFRKPTTPLELAGVVVGLAAIFLGATSKGPARGPGRGPGPKV